MELYFDGSRRGLLSSGARRRRLGTTHGTESIAGSLVARVRKSVSLDPVLKKLSILVHPAYGRRVQAEHLPAKGIF